MHETEPAKLWKKYKHNPEHEPRPYWRYDRFISSLKGYVHYWGQPTSMPFRNVDQLMQDHKPTLSDAEQQAERDREHEEYVARANRNRANLRSGSDMEIAKKDPISGPKVKRRKKKSDTIPSGGSRSDSPKVIKAKSIKGRRPPPRKAKKKS